MGYQQNNYEFSYDHEIERIRNSALANPESSSAPSGHPNIQPAWIALNRTTNTAQSAGQRGSAAPTLGFPKNDGFPLVDLKATNPYLSYAPLSTRKNINFQWFLDQLGFRPEPKASEARARFVECLQIHVGTSCYKFLRGSENKDAFDTMIAEFLRLYGSTFWGSVDRDHLAERDILKGFLCPRDSERNESRLVKVVASAFEHKARYAHYNENKRPDNTQIVRLIDFNTMTGFMADAKPLPSSNPREVVPKPQGEAVSKPSKKRDYDEHYNFLNYEEMPTYLRQRAKASKWSRSVPKDEDPENSGGYMDALGRDISSRPTQNVGDLHTQGRRRRVVRSPSSIENNSNSDSRAPLSTRKLLKNLERTAATAESPVKGRSKKHRASSTATAEPLSTTQQLQKHRPTPAITEPPSIPSTHRPSVDPTNAGHMPNLLNTPGKNTPEEPLARESVNSNSKIIEIDDSPAKVKAEPLCGNAFTKTILLVTASNEDMVPLTVPLSSYSTPDLLFTTLLIDLQVPRKLREYVNRISVKYSWSGKRLLIRKGNSFEWNRFCQTLQLAWETLGEKFGTECEVEMEVRVDE